jgi:hypothetical protein
MEKIYLLDLVKEIRNNKELSFEETCDKIDIYALQLCKGLSDTRLNKNNESIEKLSLIAYPNYSKGGNYFQIQRQAEKSKFQREAYVKGYDDALNFKFEDMVVLIDWLKRHKSKNYFEKESPAQIVSDYHQALRQNYSQKNDDNCAIEFSEWISDNWIKDPFPRKEFDDDIIRYSNIGNIGGEEQLKLHTIQELYEIFSNEELDKCDGWISAEIEPKMSGEYNVLYDLEDGEPELVVTTMDYCTVEKVWRDTRGIGNICNTVKMYKSLPKPPIQTV